MRRAAAQRVALHTSNRVVGGGRTFVEGAGDGANVMHAKCIVPPARAVDRRRRCLFSREAIGLCIAVIVTRRSAVVARTTDDRAGNLHDRAGGESRGAFHLAGAARTGRREVLVSKTAAAPAATSHAKNGAHPLFSWSHTGALRLCERG